MSNTNDHLEQNIHNERLAKVMAIKRFKEAKQLLDCRNNMQLTKDYPRKLFKVYLIINAQEETCANGVLQELIKI